MSDDLLQKHILFDAPAFGHTGERAHRRLRPYPAWTDRIDPDSARAQLLGPGFGQADDRMFGGYISAKQRLRHPSPDRRRVDDRTALSHALQRPAGHDFGADDVHLDDASKHGLDAVVVFSDGSEPFEAGVIDENVNAVETFKRRFNG